jgi:hypothetical protein
MASGAVPAEESRFLLDQTEFGLQMDSTEDSSEA